MSFVVGECWVRVVESGRSAPCSQLLICFPFLLASLHIRSPPRIRSRSDPCGVDIMARAVIWVRHLRIKTNRELLTGQSIDLATTNTILRGFTTLIKCIDYFLLRLVQFPNRWHSKIIDSTTTNDRRKSGSVRLCHVIEKEQIERITE